MMNLVKQNEKNKSKIGINTALGITALIAAAAIIMLMYSQQDSGLSVFVCLIDIFPLAALITIDLVLLLCTGNTKAFFKAFFPSKIKDIHGFEGSIEAINLITVGNIYTCCFVFVFELTEIFHLVDSLELLGPNTNLKLKHFQNPVTSCNAFNHIFR